MTSRRRVRIVALALPILLLLTALRFAGDAGFWKRYLAALLAADPSLPMQLYQPRELVPGGDGGALPRAAPTDEDLDPAALTLAADWAQQQGAMSLLVTRNGHLIDAHYWQDSTADSVIDSGDFASALLALATGVVAIDAGIDGSAALQALAAELAPSQDGDNWRNPWSDAARRHFGLKQEPATLVRGTGKDYAQLLSSQLWKPLNAGDAFLWRGEPAAKSRCCFIARQADWLRVAELLLNDGVFEEERVVPGGWVDLLLRTDVRGQPHPVWQVPDAVPQGPEPFVARGMFFVAGAHGSRLWLLPRYRLAILLTYQRLPAGEIDDTTLPNKIVRGIANRPPGVGSAAELRDLVPGH